MIGAAKTGGRRSVRLLESLAQDIREWRLASGRPGQDEPVIPRPSDGGVMSAKSFNVPLRDLRGAPARPRCALTLGTYGHVTNELDGQPRISAEDAIYTARGASAARSLV